MEVVEYTEKSIAVFGNTKPYKDELKALGGSYNSNLGGQAGWIFSNKRRDDVLDFIEEANKSSPKTSPKVIANAPRVQPKIYIKPVVKSRSLIPKIDSIPNLNLTDNSKTFIGQDGIQYQVIVTICPLPHEGQIVTVKSSHGDNDGDYIITDLMSLPDQQFLLEAGNVTIINGRWQVKDMVDTHELIFH